jgi:hypothetical protein
MKLRTDPDVLNYILTVFPPELEILRQLAQSLRERNSGGIERTVSDVEPVLVTEMWMRRVLEHARAGELDVMGIFELSACLANEMPKVYHQREAELREEDCWETPTDLEKREFGGAR